MLFKKLFILPIIVLTIYATLVGCNGQQVNTQTSNTDKAKSSDSSAVSSVNDATSSVSTVVKQGNDLNIDVNQPSSNVFKAPITSAPQATNATKLPKDAEAVTPKSSKEAVGVWSNGVKTRNGALQFSVLSPELRDKELSKYVEIGWQTGQSSPWVGEFSISNEQKISQTESKYNVQFKLASSEGPAGEYTVAVTVKNYSGKWYIAQIISPIGGLFPQ